MEPERLKAFIFQVSNVAAEQAAGKCVFTPSGVKTPEENANFMSCLKARPTKLKSFSASCEAATHKDRLGAGYYSARHGERSGQCRIASAAHAVVLSVWQDVHGFGILY